MIWWHKLCAWWRSLWVKETPEIEPAPVEGTAGKAWVTIRRRHFNWRTFKTETKTCPAALLHRTPKGANFMLANGGILHRKNRDIVQK